MLFRSKHTNAIGGIAFPPNGRSLLSGSNDKSVRLWILRDGSSKIMPVTGTTNSFLSVAFSPDGRYFAGGDMNDSLWIWDSRRQRLVAKWLGRTSSVWCVEFTPDGKGLMSGGGDGMVTYWDMASLGSGSERQSFPVIRKFSGHTVRLLCLLFTSTYHIPQGLVRSLRFFPGDNRWIVSSSSDKIVRLWDTESGICYLALHGHTFIVRVTDFSQTHNLLVTGSGDCRVMFWKYRVL